MKIAPANDLGRLAPVSEVAGHSGLTLGHDFFFL
jgi:hypothetical protein